MLCWLRLDDKHDCLITDGVVGLTPAPAISAILNLCQCASKCFYNFLSGCVIAYHAVEILDQPTTLHFRVTRCQSELCIFTAAENDSN